MHLPPFTPEGLLPAGDFPLTLRELRDSFLVTGSRAGSASWDATWRARLVDNLSELADQLWQVGIGDIFIDGSFAEQKDHPNDIDGYFECDLMYLATGKLEADLNRIDRYHCWTWDPMRRRLDTSSGKSQLPMWHAYRVELYPHCSAILSGIRDQWGNNQPFPSAFRLARYSFVRKGIVKLIR